MGTVRVGVARSDPDGVLAVPVATLSRPRGDHGPRTDLSRLADLVAEWEPLEIVVGLPVTLQGREGPAAAAVRAYAADLARELARRGLATPLRLVDERLTTAAAAKGLRSSGRDTRRGRAVIDQAAAAIIVQDALDAERATGVPPGQVLAPPARARIAHGGDRAGEPPEHDAHLHEHGEHDTGRVDEADDRG